jgi:glutathione synthase/RimK-type ligase-like ATP-grasp enzyme
MKCGIRRNVKKRCGIITCTKFPTFTDDDRILVSELSRTYEVVPVVWTEPRAYEDTDFLLIRSPWDYFSKFTEFARWLDGVAASGIPMFNSPQIVTWNFDKKYLRDLRAKLPKTLWIKRGEQIDLKKTLLNVGFERAVIKPTISAASDSTYLVDFNNLDKVADTIASLLAHKDMMIQEFMPEIVETGEYSLIFFDKKFSHAVLKRPTKGDFRVQQNFGGTITPIDLPAHRIAQAKEILESIPPELNPLYGRVDVVERSDRLLLMELELFEPHLYFGYSEEAAKRLADAIQSRLAALTD